MTSLQRIDRAATVAAVIGLICLALAAFQTAVWSLDRELPATMAGGPETTARAGSFIIVKSTAKRLSRVSCSASYAAAFTDSAGREFTTSVVKSKSLVAGVSYLVVAVPSYVATGSGVLSIRSESECNPVHKVYPVRDSITILVEILAASQHLSATFRYQYTPLRVVAA